MAGISQYAADGAAHTAASAGYKIIPHRITAYNSGSRTGEEVIHNPEVLLPPIVS